MQLALVCTLSDDVFGDLWPILRRVSRDMRDVARDLWVARMHAYERRIIALLDAATDAAMVEFAHIATSRVNVYSVVRNMAVLEGTAALVFEALRSRAPRPATLRDLLGASLRDFDRPALRDLPAKALPNEFTFAHISECLIRTGEMRVFLGTIHEPWADNERRFRDTADAYYRMQRHMWAWI